MMQSHSIDPHQENEDTIVAIATPVGLAGIGIIRLSGPLCEKIVKKIFRPKKPVTDFKSFRLYLGHLIDPSSGNVVDEVLLSLMKAPHSYTKEDVVEINSHSGHLLLSKILQIILDEDTRLAKPGEFTFRAFLNGRIDLTQAEGIIDLINSRSERALQIAAQHVKGAFKEQIELSRKRIIELLASVEVAIDFPEEEVEIINRQHMIDILEHEIVPSIEQFITDYTQRKIYMEGIRTVLAGRVNVGKSSLLNRLLNEQRAIVTPIPGTTRDVIQSTIHIEGIPIRLMDTAGLREASEEVERLGVRLTEQKLAEADLILVVLDRNRPLSQEDRDLINQCNKENSIIILNKIDLIPLLDEKALENEAKDFLIIGISALTGEGINALKRAIRNRLIGTDTDRMSALLAPNLRHKYALIKASKYLKNAVITANGGLPLEIFAMDLNAALEALGEITGETTSEDIFHQIFSEFCLGK